MNDPISNNQKNVSFRELIGITHEGIIPGRLANFYFALLLAGILGTISGFIVSGYPFLNFKFIVSVIGRPILFTFLLTACIAVVFRFVRDVYPAILIATTGYSILSVVINLLFGITPNWLLSLIFVWLWYFLVLTALHISLQKIKQIAAALVVGYFSACLIDQIARLIIYKIARPEIGFEIGYEATSLLLAVLEAVIFTGLLWVGFKLRWARWHLVTAAAAGYGAPLPGTGQPPEAYELSELKTAADTRMIQKILRPAGIGSIVFGLIAIFMGLQGAKDMPINSLLALIGVMLFFEGAWCVIDPRPVGMVVDGIALIILGVWNIIVTIVNLSAGSSSLGGFVVLGIWQISWGIQGIKRYQKYSYLSATKVTPESFQNFENMIEEIRLTSESGSENIIEFQVKRVFKTMTLKGKLIKDLVLFAGPGKEFFMEKITDVKITLTKANQDVSPLKASLSISGQVFPGEISHSSLDKYTRWVSGAQEPVKSIEGR